MSNTISGGTFHGPAVQGRDFHRVGCAGIRNAPPDEFLLRTQCGESCVDDYRSAKALASLDAIDWAKQNGGEILLGLIGVPDFRSCPRKGDVESCLWSLVDIATLATAVGKAPAVGKAIWKVGSGIAKFFEGASQARHTLERLRKLIELLRKASVPAQCLLSLASGIGGVVSFSAQKALPRASAAQAGAKILHEVLYW